MLQLSGPRTATPGGLTTEAGPRRVTLGLGGLDDLLQVRGGLVVVDGEPEATRILCRHVVSANPSVPAVVHTAEPERWTAEFAASYTRVPVDAVIATGQLRSANPALDRTAADFPLLTVTQAFPGPSLITEAAGLRASVEVPEQLGLVIVEDLPALARAWSMTDAVDYLRGWASDLGATVVATAGSRRDDRPLVLDHASVLDMTVTGGGDRVATLDLAHRRSGGRWRHPLDLAIGRIDLR